MCVLEAWEVRKNVKFYTTKVIIASIKILLSSINKFLKKITVRFLWVLYL